MDLETFLLWSHPVVQTFAFFLGLLAMWQGCKRFAMLLGKKVIFPWKKHVKLGSYALVLWTLGGLGFYTTHSVFGMTHITDNHAVAAWFIIALSVLGFVTGFVMNKYKKKRVYMPLLHGGINVLLLILVCYEVYSGILLVPAFGLI